MVLSFHGPYCVVFDLVRSEPCIELMKLSTEQVYIYSWEVCNFSHMFGIFREVSSGKTFIKQGFVYTYIYRSSSE